VGPRTVAVIGVVLAAALTAAGCSGGQDDTAPSPTTGPGAAPTSLTSPDPTTPATTPTSIGPPSPSVLPPPVTEPGASTSATTCSSLADVLPLVDLLPRDGESWPDERQRVVVDARRDAALYRQATGAAPPPLVAPLTALTDFTGWVADTVQDAGSAVAARAAIDAYPAQGEAAAASGEVDRWRRTNCP